MERRKKKKRGVEKPPERTLSARLGALLDAVFENPRDLLSLYWDIAAFIRPDERILVQKRIRRILRQRGEIAPESALLAGCVLRLSGFPAHRVLHFLSVYFRGGLSQSLFDLAVSTIFLGDLPLLPSLMYDMTQYTYLEKRLLARKSLEISDLLKKTLSSELLLFLYLLSLRDDLSNENIQLIALVMKNCFPAQEVRTRLGVASLEEYGEIARAWKEAEERTIAAEQPRESGAVKGTKRHFDRDKASFFLDRYFSDAALEKMHAEAPPLAIPARPAQRERSHAADVVEREREVDITVDVTGVMAPVFPGSRERSVEKPQGVTPQRAAAGKTPLPQLTITSRPREAAPASAVGPRPRTVAAKPVIPSRGRGVSPRPGSPTRSHAARRGAVRRNSRADVRMADTRALQWLRGPWGKPAISLWPIVPLIPFILAALISGVTLFTLRFLPFRLFTPPAGAVPAVLETPPATVQAARTYIVLEGDSLWSIFRAMGGSEGTAQGWMDFLSTTQEMNSLNNPNRIMPGNTLTLNAPDR